jgi:hypothetical protein
VKHFSEGIGVSSAVMPAASASWTAIRIEGRRGLPSGGGFTLGLYLALARHRSMILEA